MSWYWRVRMSVSVYWWICVQTFFGSAWSYESWRQADKLPLTAPQMKSLTYFTRHGTTFAFQPCRAIHTDLALNMDHLQKQYAVKTKCMCINCASLVHAHINLYKLYAQSWIFMRSKSYEHYIVATHKLVQTLVQKRVQIKTTCHTLPTQD